MTLPVRKRALRIVREVSIIVIAILVLQVGFLQAYHVPTGSMERTVMAGDYLLVDKLTLGPRTPDWLGIPWTNLGVPVPAFKLPGWREVRAGDVIVLRTPADRRTPYVKRVIATSGQTIELRDKRVLVDGVAQDETELATWLDDRTYRRGLATPGIPPALGNRDNWGPYRVPDGQLFVMGDNRDHSVDSRYFGPVPSDDVIGMARMVYFSVDRLDPTLASWQRVRFGRIGTRIR